LTSNPSPGSTRRSSGETATIGASIFVKGTIEGNDDLVIRGRVEGTVNLPKNKVIVASGSEVKGDVTARSIQVEGHVEGTLEGRREIIVRAGGQVDGDILAPRVSLDIGARLNGTIDMGRDAAAKQELVESSPI
jgi:cytoskeletal protein CcmA (bactofilin family)